eukprot:365425-Chlamydomonas_euryale.AAC.18
MMRQRTNRRAPKRSRPGRGMVDTFLHQTHVAPRGARVGWASRPRVLVRRCRSPETAGPCPSLCQLAGSTIARSWLAGCQAASPDRGRVSAAAAWGCRPARGARARARAGVARIRPAQMAEPEPTGFLACGACAAAAKAAVMAAVLRRCGGMGYSRGGGCRFLSCHSLLRCRARQCRGDTTASITLCLSDPCRRRAAAAATTAAAAPQDAAVPVAVGRRRAGSEPRARQSHCRCRNDEAGRVATRNVHRLAGATPIPEALSPHAPRPILGRAALMYSAASTGSSAGGAYGVSGGAAVCRLAPTPRLYGRLPRVGARRHTGRHTARSAAAHRTLHPRLPPRHKRRCCCLT